MGYFEFFHLVFLIHLVFIHLVFVHLVFSEIQMDKYQMNQKYQIENSKWTYTKLKHLTTVITANLAHQHRKYWLIDELAGSTGQISRLGLGQQWR